MYKSGKYLLAAVLATVPAALYGKGPSASCPAGLRDAPADSALGQLAPVSGRAAPAAVTGAGAQGQAVLSREYLLSRNYTARDIAFVLSSTDQGAELMTGMKALGRPLPEILFAKDLPAAEIQEMLRSRVADRASDPLAVAVFRNGRPRIIVFKASWPLFAVASLCAHELQHHLDRYCGWRKMLNAERDRIAAGLEKKSRRAGGWDLKDFDLEDIAYGLTDVGTFLTESLAFRRSYAITRELEKKYSLAAPLEELRVEDQKDMEARHLTGTSGKLAITHDILTEDLESFMRAYFWGGNFTRFRKAANHVHDSARLMAEMRKAGIEPSFEKILEVAARQRTYAPPARSLDELGKR